MVVIGGLVRDVDKVKNKVVPKHQGINVYIYMGKNLGSK
jgi:hypothetical protein